MTTDTTFEEPFPPGDLIREELEARDWAQADLAEILGRTEAFVSEIIGGKRGITTETAQALGEAFGTSAQWWLNMEATYRLALSRVDRSDVGRRAALYAAAPVREMIKRGWIEPSRNPELLEERVKRFLGVPSLDVKPNLIPAAARKGTSYNTDAKPAEIAWLIRVRQLAPSVHAASYSRSALEALIPELRMLMAEPEGVRTVPAMLASVGVRLVIVEPLPSTRIDGACVWPDPHSPVVAVSMRYDRIDAFWFTLMHELAHVLAEDGLRGAPPIDINLLGEDQTDDKPDYELAADAVAEEILIARSDLDAFISRVAPLYYKIKIRGFAALQGIHPGIVVGQLQHRREIDWRHSRDMLAKVRDIITQSALTDGWGHKHSIAL